VRIAIICDEAESERGRQLATALGELGLDAVLSGPQVSAPPGPTAALAADLLELEAALASAPVDAAVLIGAGDRAFAGVLVATKACVPALWLSASTAAEPAGNAALIERLADRAMPADPAEAAQAIARELGAS
jgi:hypothetical protein